MAVTESPLKLNIRFSAWSPDRTDPALALSGGASASKAANRSTLEDMTEFDGGPILAKPFVNDSASADGACAVNPFMVGSSGARPSPINPAVVSFATVVVGSAAGVTVIILRSSDV